MMLKKGSFWKFPYRIKYKEMDKGRFIKSEVYFMGLWLIDWDIRPFWFYEEFRTSCQTPEDPYDPE